MERDQGQLRAAQRPGEPGGDATKAEERSQELRCKIMNESMPQPLKNKPRTKPANGVEAFSLNSVTGKQESFLCSDLNSKSTMPPQRADQRSSTMA